MKHHYALIAGIGLALLLQAGCSKPSPDAAMQKVEFTLVDRAVDEALALRSNGEAILLPTPIPSLEGRPHAIDPTIVARVKSRIEKANATFVQLSFPGPARYDEATTFYDRDALFASLEKNAPAPVVLLLLPPTATWNTKTFSQAQERGVRWIVASTYDLPKANAWPDTFPDRLIRARESEEPSADSPFDRLFEVSRPPHE